VDWGSVFGATFDAQFFLSVLSIIMIDLVLAGDNAVVIAMAVRHLPIHQRRKGIVLGAGAAVALRVVATFFVAQLLRVSLVKLAGGAAVLWIAVHLFVDASDEDDKDMKAQSLWHAVRLIVIADISLSIDNMLAVGGASHGNLVLLIFGLIVSVPFVVMASNFLSTLMARYPVIVVAGAALLGKVATEMMLGDPWVMQVFPLTHWQQVALEACGAAAVVLAGRLIAARGTRRTVEGAEPVELVAVALSENKGTSEPL
jgi:YjbE family integral membrane protein